MMGTPSLGPTVVTGGCGFLGSNLVRELLKMPEYGPIFVISRNPKSNLQAGVDYKACDLADESRVLELLQETKPRTIFHVASPSSVDFNTPMNIFHHGNVVGTTSLLSAAERVGSVKAFVFSSTVSVIDSDAPVLAPESTPYWQRMGGDCLPYYWTKTIAEQRVLEANKADGPGLRTAALRLCLMYGAGDQQSVPILIDAVKSGQSNMQLGDNTNKIDLLSVTGAVDAHILTARLLHNTEQANGVVCGEAFNITDGEPMYFWDFMRTVYRIAGDTTKPEDVKVIPAWLAMVLANTAEAAYWLFTWGSRRPTQINKTIVNHATRNYTYDISKARRVLGYVPVPRLEEGLKEAVQFEFKKRGEVPPASAN